MSDSQHSRIRDMGGDESVFRMPHISLLRQEHWSYIQRHYRMSPRELQVARFICEGFSNEDITKGLGIKSGTVKPHLRNIYRKIRVKNKVTMLLKFMDSATKFSARSDFTAPIPVSDVWVKKPVKKSITQA